MEPSMRKFRYLGVKPEFDFTVWPSSFQSCWKSIRASAEILRRSPFSYSVSAAFACELIAVVSKTAANVRLVFTMSDSLLCFGIR